MVENNPWLTSANADNDGVEAEPVEVVSGPAHPSGPTAPQAGITASGALLPRRPVTVPARLWWVGVHGGAGERTLAALLEGSRAAVHAWPEVAISVTFRPQAVLVARTHARGLLAAQAAATEWASGYSGVDLLGLVLIADAPGRLPRPLRDLAKLVSGGVPRVWNVPWIEAWRLGESPTLDAAPKPVRAMISDLADLAPIVE
ncbi:hypothetical protein KIK06_17545 [Nocardiopsis sp. EMB25]|uniref:DUF6668 family protein n=1 Tax=Nocardiopsis sp. EMB25 TaxID=2835867 RepID=UPI002283BC6F|nr:DUF6668 family protein [Nocardiopsis sp. EMB25]MCY9785693.1 hypothetical protein [Nocardiopsis sp. EMB25]